MNRIQLGAARRRASTALLVVLPLLVAANCTAPAVRFVTPAFGAALTHMPLDLSLDYNAQAVPGSLVVTLNGWDITGLLTLDPVENGRIVAWNDALWATGLLSVGQNSLVAEVELQGEIRSVARFFTAEGDPYVDAVGSYTAGTNGGFGSTSLPGIVLGPPQGSGLYGGGLDVVSLGLGGEIVLEFVDNAVVDGPGVDFTVFENAFYQTGGFPEILELLFSEAGTVSVSQDGTTWFAFPCQNAIGDSPLYPGCAGVFPVLVAGQTPRHPSVPTLTPTAGELLGALKDLLAFPDGSGGDSFDLADVGLGWARFVRITAATHVVGPFGLDNAGFDLDAVAAVNSVSAADANSNGIPDAVE